MTVIDVDCHLEVAFRPEVHPLAELGHLLPATDDLLAEAVAGDLAAVTPPQSVPPADQLAVFVPDENRSSVEYATCAGAAQPRFDSLTATEWVAWLDRIGIDVAFVNPGAVGIMASFMPQERPRAMHLANDFMLDQLDGATDRLLPVALADWSDLDGAIAELSRMRAAGSRAFWLRAEPFGGVSPAHPDWDRVWSAATDLGMVGIIHVGNTPARFDGGWGDAGWERAGGTGLGGFFRFANSMRHQPAEMMLAAMLYGGVFGRHPGLTVLTEELGVGWLPYFVARCDSLGLAGPWPFDRTPGEMIRQQLRAAPLPGLGDTDPFAEPLVGISELFVFSSDHPHGEGNGDPITLYEPMLAAVDAPTRASFLGGNMAACFARMGDPITV